MLFKEEEKEKFIKELNQNFRTILSYGHDGLIPIGEFIVKDIQEDELPNEYGSKMDALKFTNIIFTKIDDEKTEIVLPMTTFLTKYSDLSKVNADKLSVDLDSLKPLQKVEEEAETQIISDETLKQLVDAETMTLEESGAEYLINGEVQSSNYSICPVDLSIYKEEKIKEKIKDEDYER